MRVALIGANGQLGSNLARALSTMDLVPLTHGDVDVCDQTCTDRLRQICPEVVINTAAFHRVDDVELDATEAFRVNAAAVHRLARWCAQNSSVLVHISTDYVFGGDRGRTKPLTESDAPAPLNAYGCSKLAGEFAVRATGCRHFIIRSSGLYGRAGSSGKGGNFVETMLRLAREGRPIRVVNDQRLTPTFTADLATKIAELLNTERFGLYHVTNSGDCTWYEFAAEIFRLSGLQPDFAPTTTASFGAPAPRPAYSVLARQALLAVGLPDMPHWRDALGRYLAGRRL
jgi:dTDP-4-dehydrorhamnose reductase